MSPGDEPKPHQVKQRLAELDIDPESAGAIISAIFAKGWTFWLAGSPTAKFHAAILEPRFGAVWAKAPGKSPAEALGAVFCICLDDLPWEEDPELIRQVLKQIQGGMTRSAFASLCGRVLGHVRPSVTLGYDGDVPVRHHVGKGFAVLICPQCWRKRVYRGGVKTGRLEALYVLALSLGLRQGELLGLRWQDVDLDAGRIRLEV